MNSRTDAAAGQQLLHCATDRRVSTETTGVGRWHLQRAPQAWRAACSAGRPQGRIALMSTSGKEPVASLPMRHLEGNGGATLRTIEHEAGAA